MSLKKSLPNNKYSDRLKTIFYCRAIGWVCGQVALRQNKKKAAEELSVI
jgi:hypothetical protein